MNGALRHPVRTTARLLWFAGELAFAALRFPWRRRLYPGTSDLEARACWLQGLCRRLLRILRITIRTEGPIPTTGFLAGNHSGYVDILVLSALTPAVFVAKHEMKSWPVFGWFTARAGTLFVNRERKRDVARVNPELEAALAGSVLLVVFPEGTSSNGENILPFKSSLLEPAARSRQPITAMQIEYALPDGKVAEEVCYWGDMTLPRHVINLLSKRSLRATIRFRRLTAPSRDRKELARQLREEVLQLKASAAAGRTGD